eukprot:CAMPEP_0185569700 /NCGR_PEP_ID=MMETSP0434-20130131/2242_1 /TAXON_ID=626734 ORGANISM="Favella taraikaensis, Strain Fe Narragansett Bay" /NCGR_SAMPLE_ID=MMETSP0434 /ASSEMBLY_ACC=CAM_ASM_000379 /LENGTH=80 /DNA_ID=CAMNT_0028184567 /DNA_START=798 /DNA_END=1040 /DNA_ORIENTATION=-
MDIELAKLKDEYEKKLEQAQTEGQIYTGQNTQDDEDKIALLLNTGTMAMKIKSLERKEKRSKAVLAEARGEQEELQTEID